MATVLEESLLLLISEQVTTSRPGDEWIKPGHFSFLSLDSTDILLILPNFILTNYDGRSEKKKSEMRNDDPLDNITFT